MEIAAHWPRAEPPTTFKIWTGPSLRCGAGESARQVKLPLMWFPSARLPSGMAVWLSISRTLPPTTLWLNPSQHVRSPVTVADPPIVLFA